MTTSSRRDRTYQEQASGMITMAAHFLLSPLCRTLSVAEVARMSEDEAWQAFCRIRWAATEGDPICPRCQGLVHTFGRHGAGGSAKAAATSSASPPERSWPTER